jgi:predicted N-acetyltransferase YhbS
MISVQFVIRPETASDADAIEDIVAAAFGPGRFAKTAYRLREGVPADPACSFVALTGTAVVGTVRVTPFVVGSEPSLLLGPLAVTPEFAGRGVGRSLVVAALAAARDAGHAHVVLVGDRGFYGRLGFAPVPPGRIAFPGPVDPARVLVAAFTPGAADRLAGMARSIGRSG